jgi:single-stranded DNA-binding protein
MSKMSKDNQVFLKGRVLYDAELTGTKSGTPLCNFTLSVPKANGAANPVDLSLFGTSAKEFSRRLLKDAVVSVTGPLYQSVWGLRVAIDGISIGDGAEMEAVMDDTAESFDSDVGF